MARSHVAGCSHVHVGNEIGVPRAHAYCVATPAYVTTASGSEQQDVSLPLVANGGINHPPGTPPAVRVERATAQSPGYRPHPDLPDCSHDAGGDDERGKPLALMADHHRERVDFDAMRSKIHLVEAFWLLGLAAFDLHEHSAIAGDHKAIMGLGCRTRWLPSEVMLVHKAAEMQLGRVSDLLVGQFREDGFSRNRAFRENGFSRNPEPVADGRHHCFVAQFIEECQRFVLLAVCGVARFHFKNPGYGGDNPKAYSVPRDASGLIRGPSTAVTGRRGAAVKATAVVQ